MKLSAKKENNFPDKQEKQYKTVYIDWKLYEIDESACLPHGQFAGRTLEWVMENEHSYYEWIVKNQLFGSWGLVKLRKPQTLSATGAKWIQLIEYPGNGIPSPFLND